MIRRSLFLLAVLAALLCGTACAEETAGECGAGVHWTFSDGTLTISGTGPMADYTARSGVPWTQLRDGIRAVLVEDGVTAVGNYAFYGCESLSGISLPEGLERIGAAALYGCAALTDVVVPQPVSSIGNYAFFQCGRLREARLPETLTAIGECAFAGCAALTEILLPESVTSIGYAAFRGAGLQAVRLPGSLRSMRANVFESCAELSSVVWTASLTEVPAYTFSYSSCPNRMTSLTLPEGVTQIGEGAFSAAAQLREVYLPVSLTRVESGAFGSCASLTDVYYAGTEEQKQAIRIGTENSGLRNAEWHFESLPGECGEGIHYLEDGKCRFCRRTFSTDGLDLLLLPEGLEYLEAEALRGTGAQAAVAPAGCRSVGSLAFAGCPELMYVFLPGEAVLAPDALEGSRTEIVYYDASFPAGTGGE